MKIIWSNFASETLLNIYKYHKKVAGINTACKIKNKIFNATKELKNHPHVGQIELSLENLSEEHRYLVSGNYKVIYKKVTEGILITDIFDTRQNPTKINNPTRNQ